MPKLNNMEKYDPAMEITDQKKADEYFEFLVKYNMEATGCDQSEAEQTEKDNLGYWAAYYDDETRARVERIFNCEHPIFGNIASEPCPDSKSAFNDGLQAARAMSEDNR
jgi:hypothetical protein